MKKDSISSIGGKKLDGFIIRVDRVSQGRFVEETNFELYLETTEGEISKNPIVEGKHFSGRGEFYKPWLEIYYYDQVKFKSSRKVDLSKRGLDEQLFQHLSDLLPESGHIMVIYLNHAETKKGLERGVPAPATPLGHLLWKSGCTSFKDWYFAEGFWEGDVKLQGNKPLNEQNRREDLRQTRRQLTAFLNEEIRKDKLFLAAKKRAKAVLKDIKMISKAT